MNKYSNFSFIISGSLGAGKTTAASYISQKYGYQHLSFVGEIWKPILRERGLEINRENLQSLGIELMNSIGPTKIVEILLDKAIPYNRIVIDDVRRKDVVEIIKELSLDVFLVYINVDFKTRYPRLVKRDKIKSEEEQLKAEAVETETAIPELKSIANYIINNSGNLNSFYASLDEAILIAETQFKNVE